MIARLRAGIVGPDPWLLHCAAGALVVVVGYAALRLVWSWVA